MGLFNKNAEQAKVAKTPEVVYATARSNLLLVVIFTAVNVILPLIGTDTYFLFSASMPMACLAIATLVEDAAFTVFATITALFITALYLLCWIFSKKHRGWMVAALVLFVLDTALMFAIYDISYMIVDLLIHAWVLYYLITGTAAIKKLNQQPAEITCPEIAPEQPAYDPVAAAPADTVMVNGLPVNADPEE